MARRVIAPEIFDDEWAGRLSDREYRIWTGLIARIADDQGRFIDNAVVVRSRLYPYQDVPAADVQAALDRFVADGKLHRYELDGKTLLQIVNWWRHQKPRWAARSAWSPPDGWRDRVRTRESGEYVEEAWSEPGGFIRALRTNGSYEPSHEPFVLARDPVPVPEPVKTFETPSPAPAREAAVDNAPPPPPANPSKGRTKHTKDNPPTCDGQPCKVRELRCEIRSAVGRIAGEMEAAQLYGGHTDLSRTFQRYAAHVCELAKEQFATIERPARDEACTRVLQSCVDRMVDAHSGRHGPISNLPAYLNGEIKRCSHLGDLCGDELVVELRRTRAAPGNGTRDPEALPAPLKSLLPSKNELAERVKPGETAPTYGVSDVLGAP